MPASVVQFGSVSASTATPAVVLGAAPTVGNTLVAILAGDITSSGVPTAGAGRSYAQRLKNVNNQEFTLWTRFVASGDSATTTFALTGAAPTAVAVVEIQGTFDKVGTVSSTINSAASTRTCTGLSPATTDNLVLSIAGLHGLSTISGGAADNTFTVVTTRYGTSGATQCGLIVASRLTGSTAVTGDTTVSWTGTATDRDGAQIAFTGIAGSTTLSGTVAVASAASGTLGRSQLAGSAAATSSTAGTLTPAPGAGIAGTVTLTAGAQGTVERSQAAGTIAVTAGAQGAVARSQVGGTVSAVSTLVGEVARSAAAGVADVVSAALGAVSRSQVAGAVAATSTVTGTLAVDPSSQLNITVTASLDPRRWTGALPARAKTGALNPRRWEGNLP